MSSQSAPAIITILGKDYHIACKEEEREALMTTARYLDLKMREIRDTGRVFGVERIAVMAALNLAHELTQYQNNLAHDALNRRITAIQEKIDALLQTQE